MESPISESTPLSFEYEGKSVSLIDSHLHLDMEPFDADRDEAIARAADGGVSQMITIGCGLASSHRAIAIAEAHQNVFVAVGVHPHSAAEATEEELEGLEGLLSHPKVVGIGEVGLDFFYMNSPKEDQLRVFRHFARLSMRTGMPLVIHTRDAEEETIELLEEVREGKPFCGVIHCFSGSANLAERCLEMGFYLSIPGIVTFSKSLKRVVKKLPLDRLLVETDAPFLAPKPHRGKRNEPAFVVETARAVAKLLGVSLEEVVAKTSENTRALFGLREES
ncbi:MAG: hypothetical protein CL920_17330 [Deltaproteobacteria bacterium]|nr:hypothetical protein [Deltaproteobacteria bacterium]